MKRIGTLRGHGHTFAAFLYRYRLAPACTGCAVHGGQRIVFFKRGDYVGQVSIDFMIAQVRDGNLILLPNEGRKASGTPSVVKIGRSGLPTQIVVDGETRPLFR